MQSNDEARGRSFEERPVTGLRSLTAGEFLLASPSLSLLVRPAIFAPAGLLVLRDMVIRPAMWREPVTEHLPAPFDARLLDRGN